MQENFDVFTCYARLRLYDGLDVGWDSGLRATVRAGENLQTIAAQYGAPAWAIAQINKIGDDTPFQTGMALIIPPAAVQRRCRAARGTSAALSTRDVTPPSGIGRLGVKNGSGKKSAPTINTLGQVSYIDREAIQPTPWSSHLTGAGRIEFDSGQCEEKKGRL
jgi:hypothetical protein